MLQKRGKKIVPIHPDAPTVLGEQGYATLADVPFEIDVVDVFRRSDAAGQFADEAVAVGAKGVWFQLGVIDEDSVRAHPGSRRTDGDGHLSGHRVAQARRWLRCPAPRCTCVRARGSPAACRSRRATSRSSSRSPPARVVSR